jgi:pilus assembly protein Flp/PilA
MLKIRKLFKSEKGATAIEYGLIAALVAIAAIGGMTAVGTSLQNRFTYVSNQMNSN